MSIYELLGIHRIFWSHLEEGIGHESFVPSFRIFNRENESLAFVKVNFDKPSHSEGSSYVDIRLPRHSRIFLESFG